MAQYLRIVPTGKGENPGGLIRGAENYGRMLGRLAIAEAILAVKSQTAQEHFIAVVKELERLYGFKFEYQEFPDEVKEESPTK